MTAYLLGKGVAKLDSMYNLSVFSEASNVVGLLTNKNPRPPHKKIEGSNT